MQLFPAQHVRPIAPVSLWLVCAPMALADGAVRDLPVSVLPSETFTVTITIDVPGGTFILLLEDQPPAGWTVTNISDGGSFYTQTMSVKWGPFFDPSIPASITYDVTAPPSIRGRQCFAGTIWFDKVEEPIQGSDCLSLIVPAITEWGLLTLALLLIAAGQVVILRRDGARRVGREFSTSDA